MNRNSFGSVAADRSQDGSKVQSEGHFRLCTMVVLLIAALATFATEANAAGFYSPGKTPEQRVEDKALARFKSEITAKAYPGIGEFCGKKGVEFYKVEVMVKKMEASDQRDASGQPIMKPYYQTVETYAIPAAGLYAPHDNMGVIKADECGTLEK